MDALRSSTSRTSRLVFHAETGSACPTERPTASSHCPTSFLFPIGPPYGPSSSADFPTNLLPVVTRDSSLVSTIGFARDRSVVSSSRARSLRSARRIVIALEQRASVNLPNDRLVCLRENAGLLLVGAIDHRLSDY